jgi:hypothetical protein
MISHAFNKERVETQNIASLHRPYLDKKLSGVQVGVEYFFELWHSLYIKKRKPGIT